MKCEIIEKGVQVICQQCGACGMFPFTDEQLEVEHNVFSIGITRYYKNCGVECACGNRVYTHRICIHEDLSHEFLSRLDAN